MMMVRLASLRRSPISSLPTRWFGAALATIVVLAGPAVAADDAATHDVRSYCANIAVAASDARMAWQTARLNDLDTKIKTRISDLEAKTAELRSWIEKRQDLEHKAAEKLVGIYAKMRPETAATQISSLDDDMAAAILGQLNPRQASLIFNELVPDHAAKLAELIAGTTPPAETTPPAGKKL